MKTLTYEEAYRNVFNDNLDLFARNAEKAYTNPEDRVILAEFVKEWKHLGPITLGKMSMGESWNMPLYLTISGAILNRREIIELRKRVNEKA